MMRFMILCVTPRLILLGITPQWRDRRRAPLRNTPKGTNQMETSTNAATPVPLPRLVERWVETAIRVQDTFGKIENAFMASPENEIRSAIWDMFGEYTRTLAAQLSEDAEDARGWLEWFAWECDFGRKPMEMVFANGETLLVVGASDLLAAIRTDDHGNRVWDSSLNDATQATAPQEPESN